MVIVFDTSDPRFTGENVVNFTILPATDMGIPSYGTFRFQPYDITDGYWIGFVTAMVSNDFTQVHSFFTAKGYGSLTGQTLIGTNTNGQINGEIFERALSTANIHQGEVKACRTGQKAMCGRFVCIPAICMNCFTRLLYPRMAMSFFINKTSRGSS